MAVVLTAALSVLAAGCGGEPAQLDEPAGSRLAARSDVVAVHLEAGDSCRARRVARTLRAEVERAIENGEVRGQTARELRERTDLLVRSIVCVPPPPPPPPPPPTDGDDEENEDEGDD